MRRESPMAIYMVGYDLNKSGKNYDELIEKIKEVANGWWHHLDSTWLIQHAGTAVTIRNALAPYIDDDDELLVALMGKDDAAWKGFNEKGSKWLKSNL
jgi:hypothetical protein